MLFAIEAWGRHPLVKRKEQRMYSARTNQARGVKCTILRNMGKDVLLTYAEHVE